jgi:hypothetical protein
MMKTGIECASKAHSYKGLMVHVFGRLAAALQTNWIKPKFCNLIFSFDMDVYWFIPISCKKEEKVRSNS